MMSSEQNDQGNGHLGFKDVRSAATRSDDSNTVLEMTEQPRPVDPPVESVLPDEIEPLPAGNEESQEVLEMTEQTRPVDLSVESVLPDEIEPLPAGNEESQEVLEMTEQTRPVDLSVESVLPDEIVPLPAGNEESQDHHSQGNDIPQVNDVHIDVANDSESLTCPALLTCAGYSWCLPCFRSGRRSDDRKDVLTAPLLPTPTAPLPPTLTAPLPQTLTEMEIENRLWIKKNKKFKEALEMLEAKDKLFAGRMDEKKKQSNSLRNEIYQLVGFYLVFQGVLLTAVALANLLTCYTWWSVFFLSLLACIVTIGGVIQKFYSVIALETTIASEGFSRSLCINRARTLLQKGERFSFEEDTKDPPTSRRPSSQFWLKCWTFVVFVILVAFSVLFLTSIRRILCNSELSAPALAPRSSSEQAKRRFHAQGW